MSWYKILKKWGFDFAFKDIWYRLDWRKPRQESVRTFLEEQLSIAHQLYIDGDLPTFTGTQDDKVLSVLRWVNSNLIYEIDSKRFVVAEKWQTILETLGFKRGDCEDGAILLYCICRVNGVNPLQIKLVTGNVVGGGHCWIEYMADETMPKTGELGTWFTLDWCYWYDDTKFGNRLPKSDNYKSIWWSISAL